MKSRQHRQRQSGAMGQRGHLRDQIAAAQAIMEQIVEEREFNRPVEERLDELAELTRRADYDGRWPVTAATDIIDSAVSLHHQKNLMDRFDEALGHLPPAQRLRLYGELADANYRVGGVRR